MHFIQLLGKKFYFGFSLNCGLDVMIESEILLCVKMSLLLDQVFQQIITQWNMYLEQFLQCLPFILQFLTGVPRFSRRVCGITTQSEKGSSSSPPGKGYSFWSRKFQTLALCVFTKTLEIFGIKLLKPWVVHSFSMVTLRCTDLTSQKQWKEVAQNFV